MSCVNANDSETIKQVYHPKKKIDSKPKNQIFASWPVLVQQNLMCIHRMIMTPMSLRLTKAMTSYTHIQSTCFAIIRES